MDTLTKISSIKDVALQTLLSHATRYALQHNVIAAQVEATPNQSDQTRQASAIHRDTANLLTLMVAEVLKNVPEEEAPKAPAKRAAKAVAKKRGK